jgi:hypothetical protein
VVAERADARHSVRVLHRQLTPQRPRLLQTLQGMAIG